jgi:hypothetical protein
MAGLKQHSEAEKLLLASLEKLRSDPGSGRRRVYVQATQRYLENLYRSWGKPQRAARYAAR